MEHFKIIKPNKLIKSIRMKLNKKALYISFLSLIVSVTASGQEYRPQKNSVGFNFGALTYSGRFAVGSSLADNSSLYASFAYRRRVWDKLYVRAEAFGGRMRADNTKAESQEGKPTGYFQTEMAEVSVKAEYDFIDLRRSQFTPFLNVGAGVYTLFNYTSSLGPKDGGDKTGFVMPVGGGVKYRLNNRIKLLAEGNLRLFSKNLDGRMGEGISNPNRYYSFGFGVIYELEPFNVLW
jgi:opacity protein-like surface antigen